MTATREAIKSGEALAVAIVRDHLLIVVRHAPELVARIEQNLWLIDHAAYGIAAPGLTLMLAYFDRQDSPLTDDESIAARHLRLAAEQVARLADEVKP